MRRLSSILTAGLLLGLSTQVAFADALLADGDGLAPIANGRLDLGPICHETEASSTALLAVRATNHPNGGQVFENGTIVTTTVAVISGTGIAATAADPTVVLPGNWRSQPNQTLSEPIAWTIAVTPTALGRYRATVEFTAAGVNRHGNPIARTRRINVVARVADCAAPVINNVPADVLVEAAGPDGAEVAYVPPTAIDAVDGAVAVDCDLPTTFLASLGSTTVTCAATDDAGNVGSAAFAFTVADTTVPSLTGMPVDVVTLDDGSGGAVVDWTLPGATDLVDGVVGATCDPLPSSRFAVGLTTVMCSATDGAGNVASESFTVEVTAAPDQGPEDERYVEPDTQPEPATDDADAPSAAAPPSLTPTVTEPTGSFLPDTGMRDDRAPLALVGALMLIAAIGLGARRLKPRA
jgi:hypothetical protein